MTEAERMMHCIPDDNTMEIAEYGSRYMDVKSSLYISDLMIDFLNREAKREYDQLDLDTAEFILVHRPYWLTQEIPHAETIEQMTTVRRLKIILQDLSAIDEIELTKAETKQFGMMCSAEDYGKRIVEKGLDTQLFRAMSIENADSPLDFESIRRIRDHDSEKRTAEEEFEYRQYLRYIGEMEERENERIRQAQERGVELVDVPEPEISEDFLEEQYEEISEDPIDEDLINDEAAEPDGDVMESDDDIDVYEADSAFLDNIIMCTMEVMPEATSENQTESDEEETEVIFGDCNQGDCSNTEVTREIAEEQIDDENEESEAMFGNSDVTECDETESEEMTEFLEEYCGRQTIASRLRSVFGRMHHGH